MNINTFSSNDAVYGIPGSDQGPLTVFSLSQKNLDAHYSMQHKNVCFLFDNSASMHYTLPVVKTSILTFRDLFCGRTSSFHPPVTKEIFDKYMANFNLYTFSERTKKVWPRRADGNADTDFDRVVNSIEPEGSTNMGDALETAFRECNPQKANWIIVFTDGESNKGSYQTASSFRELSKRIPVNTRLITLGYGKDFNVEILNSIGDFTFLENSESIPTFMGALTHEISTCSVFSSEIRGNSTLLFGERNNSSFSNDKIFYNGFSGICKDFKIYYTLITENGLKNVEENVNVVVTLAPVSDEIKKAFYCYKASKMIKKLLLLKTRNDVFVKKVKKYKTTLEKWTEVCASEPRESVLRLIKDFKIDAAAVCMANTLARQTSYVNDIYATPASLSMVKSAREINGTY